MESLLPLIISLLSGAAGGNIAGAAAPDKSLGTAGNSVAGLLGGGLGGYLMQALDLLGKSGVLTGGPETAPAAHGLDLSAILAAVGGGGVSGGILTFIIGLIKNALNK